MKIAAKTTIFIFIAFIVSFSYQFEDFGLLNALSHAKHNKTDSNSTLMKQNNTNNTTNSQKNISSIAGNETSINIILLLKFLIFKLMWIYLLVVNANKTESEQNQKQKNFLKKSQNKGPSVAKNNTNNSNDDESQEKGKLI